MKFFNTGLIFGPAVFILCKKVWEMRVEGREVRYTPYQAPKMELFVEIVNGYFRKIVLLTFEICLKGF